MVNGRVNFDASNIFPTIFNDCSLFVEKHMFNDGTHIRQSPGETEDEESISDDETKI